MKITFWGNISKQTIFNTSVHDSVQSQTREHYQEILKIQIDENNSVLCNQGFLTIEVVSMSLNCSLGLVQLCQGCDCVRVIFL